MARRIIRIDDGVSSVAAEAKFTEAELHAWITAHPEVLPTEDLRMGPLVPLASELDLGAGPMDLLAADSSGRLVVIEFKRGIESGDVRKVVAQVLDYGSMLWRKTYEELEQGCRARLPGFSQGLEEHVGARLEALGEVFEPEQFRSGVASCLEAGSFVFLYVGRQLDDRSRRIMTFLAEGARMTFFAVEVDRFGGAASASVVVPRTAFVPSWIAGPDVPNRRGGTAVFDPTSAPPAVAELVRLMDGLAVTLGLRTKDSHAGRNYYPPAIEEGVSFAMGVGVYTLRGAEFNLLALRQKGQEKVADQLLGELRGISGLPLRGLSWPAVPCEALVEDWERARASVMEPYFAARRVQAASGER